MDSLDYSTKETTKFLMSLAFLCAIGLVESRFYPWGLGMSVVIPLIITYSVIAFLINHYKYEDEKFITYITAGLKIGCVVYSIVFSWLFTVGFLKDSTLDSVIKFTIGVTGAVITSLATKEISKIT